MNEIVNVQTTANVSAFGAAWANFGTTFANYLQGAASQTDVINAAGSLVSAATALSKLPGMSAIANLTGFASGVSSFQSDLKAYQDAKDNNNSAEQTQAMLAIVADVAGITVPTAAVVALVAPPTAPAMAIVGTMATAIGAIATTAQLGDAAVNALTEYLQEVDNALMKGAIQDIQDFQINLNDPSGTGVYMPGLASNSLLGAPIGSADSFQLVTLNNSTSDYLDVGGLQFNLADITSASGSTPSHGEQETFVASTTGNMTTLTGNMGDTVQLTIVGDPVETITTNQGYSETQQISTTGAPLSDTWSNAAGVQGTDTYHPDGSSTGKITYANGSYALYTDDGQGNISTDYYTAGGAEIRATWVHADGTAGEVTSYDDGLTVVPGTGSSNIGNPSNIYAPMPSNGAVFPGTGSVPMSAYTVLQNPDGSYVTDAMSSQGVTTGTDYTRSGTVTATTTGVGPGVNDQTVVSSRVDDFNVISMDMGNFTQLDTTPYNVAFTANYNASGGVIGASWQMLSSDTSVPISWAQNARCVSGTRTNNAGWLNVETATAVDGTVWQLSEEAYGSTVSQYTGSKVIQSDQWADYDSMIPISLVGPYSQSALGTPAITGSDTFNGNAGSGSFSDTRDGTSGTITLDGTGNISINNFNAGGTLTSTDSWEASSASYTITMYNSAGAELGSYDYLGNAANQPERALSA